MQEVGRYMVGICEEDCVRGDEVSDRTWLRLLMSGFWKRMHTCDALNRERRKGTSKP